MSRYITVTLLCASILFPGSLCSADKGEKASSNTKKQNKIRKVRSQLIEYNFDQTSLSDVIDTFRHNTGVTFHVSWNTLKESDITKDTPVSFKLKNISTETALNYTMDAINHNKDAEERAYWVIDSGIVRITTGKVLNQKTKLKVIDITDLLAVITHNAGPRVDSNAIGEGGSGGEMNRDVSFEENDDAGEDNKTPAEILTEKKEMLIKMVKDSIGEEYWEPAGKGKVEIVGNRMLIRQTVLGFKLLAK